MAENGATAEAAVEKVAEQVEKVAVTNDAEKIGNLVVKKVPGLEEEAKISSLWQDESVVITFFRRFGCVFCRQASKELSILKPLLDKHNVKLIGIGMDQVGLDDFVQGNYFAGELYIDPTKETYKALGYKRLSYFGVITSFFSKASREAYSKSKGQVTGNFKGDGLQNGGTIIVKKGGEEVLLSYKAENPADHVLNQDILNALGITDPIPEVNGESTTNGHKEDEKSAENGKPSENGTETPEEKKEVNGVSAEPAAANEPQAAAS